MGPACRPAAHLAARCILWRQVIDPGSKGVYHAEVHTHISHALAADWAGVVVLGILPEAVAVHEVPAGQLLQAGHKQGQCDDREQRLEYMKY